MRKLLLLLFVTIASQMLQAQNYNPFIFGKTYRYLYTKPFNIGGLIGNEFNEADSVVFYQKIDSVYLNQNNDSVFLSVKRKYVKQINGLASNIEFACYIKKDTLLTFYNSENPNLYENVVYKINTKAKIGDTLYLGRNSYSKYIKNEYVTFLGVSDSVKVFEINAKINYKDTLLGKINLSKNYGFVNVINPGDKLWNNQSYFFGKLFSLKELNLGFRAPMPYRASIGDTIVWGYIISSGTPPCTKDSYSVCTQKENDDFILSKFNYELIDSNKYIGIFESLGMEGGIVDKYQEGLGKFESYFSAEMRSCTDGIAYYKGAQGEFGDRKRLTDLLTSIDNSEIEKYLNIYPNPSNKTIYVNSLNNSLVTIDIYDLQGSKIKSIQSEQQLTSFDLNSGLYLLKLNVDNKVFTQKVIVE